VHVIATKYRDIMKGEPKIRLGTGKREDFSASMRQLLAKRDLFARAKSLESPAAYCMLGIPPVYSCIHVSYILIYQLHEQASDDSRRT